MSKANIVRAWTEEQKEHARLAKEFSNEAQMHDKEMRKARDAAKSAASPKEKSKYKKLAKEHEAWHNAARMKAESHKSKSVTAGAIGVADYPSKVKYKPGDNVIDTDWSLQFGLDNPKLLTPIKVIRSHPIKKVRKLVKASRKVVLAAMKAASTRLGERVVNLHAQIINEAHIAFPNGPNDLINAYAEKHPRHKELMKLKRKHIIALNTEFKANTLHRFWPEQSGTIAQAATTKTESPEDIHNRHLVELMGQRRANESKWLEMGRRINKEVGEKYAGKHITDEMFTKHPEHKAYTRLGTKIKGIQHKIDTYPRFKRK